MSGCGLYLHFPFCRRKCPYCAFVSGPEDAAQSAEYLDLLLGEVRLMLPHLPGPVTSLYLGGGTPSLISPSRLTALWRTLANQVPLAQELEFTIEANPESCCPDFLRAAVDSGGGRISLGVQTLNDAYLQRLGRVHTAAQARRAFDLARQVGFASLSVDLIFGLPGQTLDGWQTELKELMSWCPDHISLYGLTVHSGTPWAQWVQSGGVPPPDEDLLGAMHVTALEILEAGGYPWYELSNAARPGHACRHNLNYWQRGPYLGCGAAAHSFAGNRRWWNPAALDEYFNMARNGTLEQQSAGETLTSEQACHETLMLGLRMRAGLDIPDCLSHYGQVMPPNCAAYLEQAGRAGLVWQREARWGLTARGAALADEVTAGLVARLSG